MEDKKELLELPAYRPHSRRPFILNFYGWIERLIEPTFNFFSWELPEYPEGRLRALCILGRISRKSTFRLPPSEKYGFWVRPRGEKYNVENPDRLLLHKLSDSLIVFWAGTEWNVTRVAIT